MNKQEFLDRLRKGLAGLPKEDTEERLTFYAEMIDDRMEEGCSEEQAVSAVGAIDDIVAQIVAETPFTRIVKERIKPKRRLRTAEIVLLVLGSPIWLSLLLAAAVVVLSVYIVLWSVIVSLWAVFASLIGCAVGGVAGGIVFACTGHALTGVAVIGAGLACAGLSVFMCFGCRAATKGTVKLTALFARWIKTLMLGKEEAQ